MKFLPGDVGFVMNDSLWSKPIAWFMSSQWSHSFIVLGEIHGITMVIETSDFQVTINRLDRYLDGRPICILRPDFLNNDVCAFRAIDLLDKIYGYLQLLSFAIRAFLKRFNINIKNLSNQGVVCCGVLLYAYQKYFNLPINALQTEEVYQLFLLNSEIVYSCGVKSK